MVPIPASSYFPPLDECLSGEQLLISWRTVLNAIGDCDRTPPPTILKFLSDPQVLQIISRPFDAFPVRSPQTKAAFETKTSAINVTPSSTRYDIKEVKEDALWLSDKAGIDETVALRIVVEECQSRAAARLQGPLSEEELSGIREAAGNNQFSSPITVSLASQGKDAVDLQSEFNTKENRQERILITYLSERQHLLKCFELVLSAYVGRDAYRIGVMGKDIAGESWLDILWDVIVPKPAALNGFILDCIGSTGTFLENALTKSGWYKDEYRLVEIEWARAKVVEATHVMEILFQLLKLPDRFSSTENILTWLNLLQSSYFLAKFDESETEEPVLQTLAAPLQCAAVMVSLAFFNVNGVLQFVEGISQLKTGSVISDPSSKNSEYLTNTHALLEIHQNLLEAANAGFPIAGPILIAWTCILKGLHVSVAENKQRLSDDAFSGTNTDISINPYTQYIEEIMQQMEDQNPLEYLALTAINRCNTLETLNAFALRLGSTPNSMFSVQTGASMRVEILDLIKSLRLAGLFSYGAEIVELLLSSLSGGDNYWSNADCKPASKSLDPTARFLEDEVLSGGFLGEAISRYPYESQPLLRLIHAVSSCASSFSEQGSRSAITILETIQTITYQLPDDFLDFELPLEVQNTNDIVLKRPINLFEPRSSSNRSHESLALTLVDKDFCIPTGANGRIISESPRIAFWFHQYSGMKYFGKLLETYLAAGDLIDATTGSRADPESVVEIIEILASLLLSISKSSATNANWRDDALYVLEVASAGLNRNRDIMTVIFDIFEEELQRVASVSGSDVPLGILVSCVHFLHALIPYSPSRVWPLLARSALLGINRSDGRLLPIVEAVEAVSGYYEFLISCTRLYEALVDDVASNAIRRRSGVKLSGRFGNREEIVTGIPDQTLAKIILAYSRQLIDVLESSFSWRFSSQNDRFTITRTISTTFKKVLLYVFGIEGTDSSDVSALDPVSKSSPKKTKSEIENKITGILIPAASLLVDSFLASSTSSLRFQPLLMAYLDGLNTPDLTVLTSENKLWKAHVVSALDLSKTLIRLNDYLERPRPQLESNIFKSAPLLARLYASHDYYKTSVVGVLEALIVAAADGESEPPSLLGHLGQYTAKNFLDVLSDIDKPLSRETNTTAVWHFLATVISHKQQWFANSILTGKTPRIAAGFKAPQKDQSSLDKPVLATALEALTNIAGLPMAEVLPMLEFASLAQNYWPWTIHGSPKNADFIKAIANYVGTLPPIQPSAKLQGHIDACFQTKIATHIGEILAMHLFHCRQTGAKSAIVDLVENISYYCRFAVEVPRLNSSLHTQLKRNFEARYPGCTPHDLQRTVLEERPIGINYFYDLSLADQMLQPDQAWTGRKNDGLRLEFETANVNLSLVDAQIALFHSWEALSIEALNSLPHNERLQEELVKVVLDCLISNLRSQDKEEIFARLCYQRANFALILTQHLIEARTKASQMKQLLSKTWDTIRSLRGTYERELRKEEMPYYRSLLKLLFISIRVHTDPAATNANLNASVRMAQSANIIPVILDIIKYAISIDFRTLASSIHSDPASSSPSDIQLLTGILSSCLRVPGVELCYASIVSTITSNNTARVATTLFSWSDSLAIDGDPIYGELAMLFLLELSSIPAMAEQLAIDGILGHIASANITSYLRRGNVSPFAEGAGLQRCYSIWQRGILPLLLNLLDAVQGSIAGEVATFLNQFEPLLTQTTRAIAAPERTALSNQTSTPISLSLVSSLHSLALITHILATFRNSNMIGSTEIPEVKWDSAAVGESVEYWLGAGMVLRERIVPMGTRDVEMFGKKRSGSGVSVLEERIVEELRGVRDILAAET